MFSLYRVRALPANVTLGFQTSHYDSPEPDTFMPEFDDDLSSLESPDLDCDELLLSAIPLVLPVSVTVVVYCQGGRACTLG